MTDTKKTVLIIGGGYAGLSLVSELNKKKIRNLNIILISKADYFYHNVASPRTIVDDKIISDIALPFDNIIKGENKKFIHGKVTKIDKNQIKYLPIINNNQESNEEKTLDFDYLAIGVGTKYSSIYYSGNSSIGAQLNEMRETNEKFKKSTKVLVVGGGPVGIETAGEIATDFPQVRVTLLSNRDKLIPYMPQAFSDKTLGVLREKNVEVIFNDSIDLNNVENFKSNTLSTKKGKKVEFDAYFICYGGKPYTDFLKESYPNWLDENGRITVNKHLQVSDCLNIFAMGDCCNTKEFKLAYLAGMHGEVVADNIDLLLNHKTKLKEYSVPSKTIMIMSIGRDNGVFQLACMSFTGFLPKQIKSKSLFISKYKETLGFY
jgi:NADH dehydrogenase FAD-containing subunit